MFQLLVKGASRLNGTLSVSICMSVLCFGAITAAQVSYKQLQTIVIVLHKILHQCQLSYNNYK